MIKLVLFASLSLIASAAWAGGEFASQSDGSRRIEAMQGIAASPMAFNGDGQVAAVDATRGAVEQDYGLATAVDTRPEVDLVTGVAQRSEVTRRANGHGAVMQEPQLAPFVEDEFLPIDRTIGLVQRPREPSPRRGALDVLSAAFQNNNTIVSYLSMVIDLSGEMAPVVGYSAWEEIKGTPYERFWEDIAGSQSPAETTALKARIDREQENDRTLAAAGLWGIAAKAFAFASPLVLVLPFFVPVIAQLGARRRRREARPS